MSLASYLEAIPVQSYHYSLTKMLKIAGVKAVSQRKADIIRALDAYLSNEANIIKLWHSLPPVEQDFLEEFLRNGGIIELEDILEILQKHNLILEGASSYFINYFSELSPARLFLIGGGIPEPIAKVLSRFVQPMEPSFTTIPDPAMEEIIDEKVLEELVVGESFAADCLHYLKLVNSSKLRTTKTSGLPTKAAMLKINEVLLNKELLLHVFSMEDYRVVEQTTRIYGLTQLLRHAAVLDEEEGILTIGLKADEFLTYNTAGKCRFLLHTYINAEELFELERIRGARIKVEFPCSLNEARETILKHLAQCPINAWIALADLKRLIRKNDRWFLTKVVGDIELYSNYDKYYYLNRRFDEVEGKYVEVVLLEYLSAVGIVDLMISEEFEDYSDKAYLKVDYLRLTPLGAYVLGVNDHYKEPEVIMDQSGIIVQPNFEVVVVAGGTEAAHILYLDRFGEKISQGGVNVYKITFKAIINALDQGIPVQELIDYFEEFSTNPVPENVLLTLNEWERESKRIHIRTVTILETDDPYILEELKNYKTINKHIRSELPHVLEIDAKSAKKIKREIEKKNRFCIMSE